jgi:DNA mismatch repair protein MutS2
MGGKTVALKTVGLLCAMAQSGLHIPAGEGTSLPFVDQIYVDLGDEQSIEKETSTFAGHLRNIGHAWEGARERSLVLLDELGGGTDPEEGTALGRALIELLTERGSFLLVTTHLIGLKMVAHEDPRMLNAAMEFDPKTQRPTYTLRIGAPGRSRAFELARQILKPGELLRRAEGYRTRFAAKLDELLGDLERRRTELQRERDRLKKMQGDLQESIERKESQADKLRKRLQVLREERWERESRSIQEAEALLAEARRIRKEIERSAAEKTAAPTPQELRRLESQVSSIRGRKPRPKGRGSRPLARERILPGGTAWSYDLQAVVGIESEPDRDERVWITHGAIRFHVPTSTLGEIPDGVSTTAAAPTGTRVRGPVGSYDLPREIDLRGKTVEESLGEVERFIDRAAIASIPEVRIIHGKGTGTLKREIEGFLQSSDLVESFRIGEPREGGWGATIVRLRSAQVGD